MNAIQKYNLHIIEYGVGEMLCFQSDWIHEVHNLTPTTIAVADAAANPWYFDKADLGPVAKVDDIQHILRMLQAC